VRTNVEHYVVLGPINIVDVKNAEVSCFFFNAVGSSRVDFLCRGKKTSRGQFYKITTATPSAFVFQVLNCHQKRLWFCLGYELMCKFAEIKVALIIFYSESSDQTIPPMYVD
jgi:hypothetical protein